MNDEVLRWAMSTPLPSSKQVGEHAARVVLLAWAMHANNEGVAWPSYERLSEMSGVHRWSVQNAVKALEEEGVLGRVTRSGIGSRAVARQALTQGMPVVEVIPNPVDNSELSPGMPSTNRVRLSPGSSPGVSPGVSPGMPTWKKKKKRKKKENKERTGLPSDREWRAFMGQELPDIPRLKRVGACGHELIDERHCWRGCAIAVNA